MREEHEFNPEVQKEKQARWDEERRGVDQLADALGKPIDEGIKETVTAHRLLGFETTGSCEGHIEEDRIGTPYMAIGETPSGELMERLRSVQFRLDNLSEEDREAMKRIREKNLRQYENMLELLEEFYGDRDTPYEQRLSPSSPTKYGNFRLESYGSHAKHLRNPDTIKKHIPAYQVEMQAFGEFLKGKYFTEK